MKRRDFLRSCGLVAAGTAFSGSFASAASMFPGAAPGDVKEKPLKGLDLNIRALDPNTDHPVTAIIIGCGNRGGDLRLVRDFVEAVAAQDPGLLSSSIDVSIESHMMGFAAELSRRSGKKEKVR